MTAQALAKRLGRPLAVQWYESKLDEDASSTIEANALLSDGRCDLVAGYPLVKDALGKPGLETARLPDFAGAQPADRRRRVELGTLDADDALSLCRLDRRARRKGEGTAHRKPCRSRRP